MGHPYDTTSYRYPSERLILALTFFLVFSVIAITAAATLLTGLVFVAIAVGLSYFSSRSHHRALLRRAQRVTPATAPSLAAFVKQCVSILRPEPVEVFIAPTPVLNAYTFGLDTPKVVVLYSGLFNVMDEDELRFILGHELGHVKLGHTRLNSLVGGMAGIPSSSGASALLTMAFLWWNRACEYSADRAGLLACGKPEKAITALIKLVAGPQARTQAGMELAYRQIDAEDDTLLGSLNEALSSHPMIIRRIRELRRFASSSHYRRLQASLNQNLR
jgi:Zn-dependent protease with chaperone function